MRRYKISELGATGPEHVVSKLVPGQYIDHGSLSFHSVGMRTHSEGEHRHTSHEIFVIMQGQGEIEIDGQREPVHAGEVLVVEPGEDHHIVGDPAFPIVNLWFHTGDDPHSAQRAE